MKVQLHQTFVTVHGAHCGVCPMLCPDGVLRFGL